MRRKNMKINNFMLFVSQTFAIIGYLCVSGQTFNNNNDVTGPTTTSFITTTTTLASILSNNYSSYPTPFVPSNVSPINFHHTDAILSGGTLTHHHHHGSPFLPKPPNPDAILFGNEVKSLSELPLETLLKIKKHLEEMTNGMSSAQPDTAANVIYPVYEHPSSQQDSHQGAALSPGYLNLGGGTFSSVGGHEGDGSHMADVGFVTTNNGQFTKSGEILNFHDHSKTELGETGYGYITPQPFIHKFKK